MNKRGQIYILAALILAVAFYLLLTKTNIIFENPIEDDFEELSKNYDLESAKFVNSLLEQPGEPDVENSFKTFTDKFTSYSELQNPDFGLIYIFNYKGVLYVGNYLAKGYIYVWPKDLPVYYPLCSCLEEEFQRGRVHGFEFEIPTSTETCCYSSIESGADEAELMVDGIVYIIPIIQDRPELVIIGSETKAEQKKVYMRDVIPGDFDKNFGKNFCKKINENKANEEIRKLGQDRCISEGNINCRVFYKGNKNGCIIDDSCCWDYKEEICKTEGECKE